ncbi:MAG: pantetheine-phosphate adenylyltransferase [Clostridia bacterium]|nr:pantetheine-phosphate adenylyltransferase [Clostridia bacterium]
MKIAVCPGSFDPITNGHVDIISRASRLFDKVIVVVMINYHKPNSYFTASERVELIRRAIPPEIDNCEVDMYGGLLAEYCEKKGACAVVKGLRAVSDFEYEFQQALTNKHLNPTLETVFMTTDQNNMFLSSSLVKQLCEFGADVSEFVPEAVCSDIIRRIKERGKYQ